jgi:hypothetical protein
MNEGMQPANNQMHVELPKLSTLPCRSYPRADPEPLVATCQYITLPGVAAALHALSSDQTRPTPEASDLLEASKSMFEAAENACAFVPERTDTALAALAALLTVSGRMREQGRVAAVLINAVAAMPDRQDKFADDLAGASLETHAVRPMHMFCAHPICCIRDRAKLMASS